MKLQEYGPKVVVGFPWLDWLTLNSFVRLDFEAFKSFVRGWFPDESKWVPAQFMQYVGFRAGPFWGGVGMQPWNGRPERHYSFGASGSASHDLLGVEFEAVQCSRVDLQLTVPLLEGYSAWLYSRYLREPDVWRGQTRQVELIEGPEKGLDTVYIGSKKSDRFIRVYVKDVDGVRYLRLEVQYRKRKSKKIYPLVWNDREMVKKLLKQEFEAIPAMSDKTLQSIEADFLDVDSADLALRVKTTTNASRMRHIYVQVLPMLEQMLNDHEYGPVVSGLLYSLLEETGRFT